MKSPYNNINFALIFVGICLISCFININKSFSQGFNNNEWVFGYCGPNDPNNYLSFGKSGDPIVRSLPGSIVVGANNNALAIDPITGQKLFFSNGELVYNYDNVPLQGAPNGFNGDFDGRQTVAIGALDYDPDGEKLFYAFYISPSGQLLYSVVDMNAPGGASANQPPLGAVTALDQPIGPASGAIAVVKTAASPSYLISFAGGNLISRSIESTQGDFTLTATQGIPFTPKAIVFNESTGQLILIPENAIEDLLLVDFDTATGSFGAVTPISQSGSAEEIEGASFSPDGVFVYFSRGDELLRVPVADLGATPSVIPFGNDIFKVYDLKIGPDGKLYYLYEEVLGGPQLIGVVNNPNESDLDLLELDEDPFNGTDFCGRVFPQFAPNQDINPTVDFEWNPEEPCSNNPVQLTSLITPENYRPVSFVWTFEPALTDEDGQPVDIDFNQEHLLIPEEATADQSITVTLTVTFADGSVVPVTKTITLKENDLEANFSAQDTTVCEGACVDIGSLLEVQKGGGGDGENPNVGGGGGGQQENYEYFWSNRRGEGWVKDKENCVLLPGLYWVLVREEGSDCYAYASIRVKIWDLPDQSNNVWYFGDGAGLDFNPDPNDPNAPVPRPVSHPTNIPAGTTTISDETGQVLFYTDGETVWDLNGDTMANGDSIGGSNLATQSVVAVPLPQDETIFYLFTTQKAEDGTNQVKFSLVDIKVDNPTGVGNVVSKDNFLFSPSTEHSAGLNSGDTTWVIFHELGNNTFRTYPVTTFGIGPPVLSSVGSAHTFGSGVGSMKFSPDGSKLAVTIQNGSCSRLEIFDFNQTTGKLTEYALLELSCSGEDVYGLEFSDDSNRVFVSYTGGGGKIEEFLIKNPDAQGAATPSACATCFENAGDKAAVESCILGTRNTLSSAGPFGALQIGPDGQIYVARPGQNVLGTINAGQGCANSAYVEMGTSTLTGTTNLGLPSFVQNSGSSIPEPTLGGPDRLCLDPENGTEALFEGGGEPDIDSYFWTIVSENGQAVLTNFGGPGEEFQTLTHVFQEDGTFTVSLRVDRCGDANYFEASMEVVVVAPPPITLVDDVTLCSGTPVTLVAIDGYDPNEGLYDFEWRNAAGQLIGDENSNSIAVEEESIYTVTVSYRTPSGSDTVFFDVCPASKSVFVGPAFEFDLTQSAEEVCYDETLVVFAPNTPVIGDWYYQQVGSPTRTLIGEFFELELIPTDLPAPGLYEIIFITEDPIVPGCLVEKKLELLVHPLPNFELLVLTDADDCATPNGSFEITALLDAERIEILETGEVFNNVNAGDVLPVISNLEPGIYTVQATNSFGCVFTRSVTIANLNPPVALEYTVAVNPEVCGPNEVENGAVIITFSNGPQSGSYVLTRQQDGLQFSGTITNQEIVTISVPEGDYAVEVSDALGCTLPEPVNYLVDEKLEVDFTVPTNLIACGLFSFIPQTNQSLVFTLTDALGNGIAADANGEFTLLASGAYQITGEDPTGIDCPRVRTMNVEINGPIGFSLSGPADPCATAISYDAILNGTDPADVFFFWKNESGAIVGRNQTFFPAAAGEYSLEVQPRAGSLCPAAPIDFTVEDFGQPVNVVLDALPFCGDDPFTTITVVADLTNVASIQWFSLQGGVATLLPGFDDQQTITVIENGVYQAVLFSGFGCELGRQQVQITKSFITPPVLETRYVICAAENVVNVLDPGVYDNYSWELEGEEVSNSPTFTPTLPGNYALTVSDEFDCLFTIEFVVEEDCELKIIFPNAMRPSDPSRLFVVYANDFIDHVDVLIYNRWGELIYFCESENVQGEEVLCTWDGTVGGRVVPIGTYPVIVRFRSENQNIVKTIRKSIVVIE
ncbi:hypothetical protein P872_23705 [Rhodonellum psychrophilum GCM71 = DSM 17998]|uniref:PKD domain-containing protein n=2 Tax=Rhodonellum TaxID=336827 RepID=U5C4H4_9BACT|nr:hypothetical protein P872_23705 [Rhodonellum psychrophilum GCM71 = DSM 17998]SDZ12711.1 hypothetical protein SAMN05444412_10691 [Rhodonellum ikkaensis]